MAGKAAKNDAPVAEATAGTTGAPEAADTTGTIVIRSKKKKRRSSRGLRTVRNVERGTRRSTKRVSKAVFRGLARFDRLQDKSSRKKRDGAIRDALENWSRAMGKTLRVSSNAPYDFVREVNTKRFSRQLRDLVRVFTIPGVR